MRAQHSPSIQIARGNPRSLRIVSTTVAAALIFAVGPSSPGVAAAAQENTNNGRPTDTGPIVIGTGPDAVYIGPAPTFGGDPARGETDNSYSARTGRHLPGRSSATVVDGSWWHGAAPVTGGDPAPGETDDSYYARTGRHLPD
jgi:hypothetical protein